VLQVVHDALYSAILMGIRKKTSELVDTKFKTAIVCLSAYELQYHLRMTVPYAMVEAEAKDKLSRMILKGLKETLRVRKHLDLCFATY
jgi:hypothetical protein